ncbi:MAG: hypothetical protein E7400_07295 [Ruminococcaceae bacterium]|nr:hypothetical protein [Oscillospiraceae bacterium]
MMKRMIRIGAAMFALVILLSLCFQVYASPDVLPGTVVSTAEGYLNLLSPEQLTTSTTNKSLPVSALAPDGTEVTVYRYNISTGNYHKIVKNEVPLEAIVGATSLFAGRVDLTPGLNKFLIRGARDENTYTVVPFEVNVLNEGFMDRIKGVISVIFG